jgi:osmotically-inducible protein OsmY
MTLTTLKKRTEATTRGAGQATAGALREIARRGEGLSAARERAGRRIRVARRSVGYRIAGERPPSTARRVGTAVIAGAAGAAAAFFLDPVSGRRRRLVARDRVASAVRRARERAARRGRYLKGQAAGALEEARRGGTVRIPPNDQALAHKVESEALGYAGIPSGRVNVNAESGVVILRGRVDGPDDVRRIEKLVREVDGVRDVENLLHTSNTSGP